MAPAANNRRIYVRIPVTLHAALRDDEFDGEIYFVTRDLSVGGVFLESDLLFDIGTELRLSFSLPTDERRCQVEGEVAWTLGDEELDERPGMGVRFRAMPEPTRLQLMRFVQDRAGRITYD